ncbi:hypothetical protein GCM10023205_25540 [Yinghuangia aomiensis]|uniref:Uncharacterized protein n=1 Tax=Yinghuangia aomiensis TaxID=676205 RepID=A0ABP9H464_9ACTN
MRELLDGDSIRPGHAVEHCFIDDEPQPDAGTTIKDGSPVHSLLDLALNLGIGKRGQGRVEDASRMASR